MRAVGQSALGFLARREASIWHVPCLLTASKTYYTVASFYKAVCSWPASGQEARAPAGAVDFFGSNVHRGLRFVRDDDDSGSEHGMEQDEEAVRFLALVFCLDQAAFMQTACLLVGLAVVIAQLVGASLG